MEEDYSNSFFKPKPRCTKIDSCMDLPCSVDPFICSEGWWRRNIKNFIEMIEEEFDYKVEIDIDEIDNMTVDVRVDNKYIMTAKSKEEISTILKTVYSVLSVFQL